MSTPLSIESVNALCATEPAWLQSQRQTAWHNFQKLALPSSQEMDWQRLDIRAIQLHKLSAGNGSPFVLASLSSLSSQLATKGTFFCDLRAAVQQQPELVARYLGCAIGPSEPSKFIALQGALWSTGAFLYVPRDVQIAEPLEITYDLRGTQSAGLPRTLIVLAPYAEATVVQRFLGGPAEVAGAPSVHASATEVFVEEGARLHYISLQDFGPHVFDFTYKRAHVARDASIDWVLGMFGGSFLRYDVQCLMEGQGGTSYMYGVGIGEQRQQLAQFTRQHHQVGNTTSDLLFKNVLRERAVSYYAGVIRVEKHANGTNAYQSNRNLVLDPHVQCDTRPILEIESNQLRCTHGATVGRLDENQLFYLRSRGLPEARARQLLIEAFLNPVLDRIRVAPAREEFAARIHRKLGS